MLTILFLFPISVCVRDIALRHRRQSKRFALSLMNDNGICRFLRFSSFFRPAGWYMNLRANPYLPGFVESHKIPPVRVSTAWYTYLVPVGFPAARHVDVKLICASKEIHHHVLLCTKRPPCGGVTWRKVRICFLLRTPSSAPRQMGKIGKWNK